MDDTRIVKAIGFKRPETNKKSGRPMKEWSVVLMKDIREWKISNWRKKAKYRQEWKKDTTKKL